VCHGSLATLQAAWGTAWWQPPVLRSLWACLWVCCFCLRLDVVVVQRNPWPPVCWTAPSMAHPVGQVSLCPCSAPSITLWQQHTPTAWGATCCRLVMPAPARGAVQVLGGGCCRTLSAPVLAYLYRTGQRCRAGSRVDLLSGQILQLCQAWHTWFLGAAMACSSCMCSCHVVCPPGLLSVAPCSVAAHV
jgi:hypothetical protein